MRTFFAYKLDESVLRELKRIQNYFKPKNRELRWVNPDNMHITIKFLGETSETLVSNVQEDLQEKLSAFSPFSLKLSRNGQFPKKRAPRILWTGFEQVSDVAKQQAFFLNSYFQSYNYEITDKPFSPHITQCRIKTVLDNEFLSEYIHYSVEKLSFDVKEVFWFESKHINGKLQYIPLHTFKLKA